MAFLFPGTRPSHTQFTHISGKEKKYLFHNSGLGKSCRETCERETRMRRQLICIIFTSLVWFLKGPIFTYQQLPRYFTSHHDHSWFASGLWARLFNLLQLSKDLKGENLNSIKVNETAPEMCEAIHPILAFITCHHMWPVVLAYFFSLLFPSLLWSASDLKVTFVHYWKWDMLQRASEFSVFQFHIL